jgi:hypothetical protein
MKTRLWIIIGIVSLILGIDGFLFVSSEIHENCIFNLRLGHEVYADSFVPCEIASYVSPLSIMLFTTGLGILIFCTIKKLRYRLSRCKIEHEN